MGTAKEVNRRYPGIEKTDVVTAGNRLCCKLRRYAGGKANTLRHERPFVCTFCPKNLQGTPFQSTHRIKVYHGKRAA